MTINNRTVNKSTPKSMTNNRNKSMATKLRSLALLTLPFSLAALNSAQAADFPVFGDDELYFNHIASSVPGNNLVVNPTFDIAACANYEAAVLAASVACTNGETWGWTNVAGQAQGQPNVNYAPGGVPVVGARLGKVTAGNTGKLSQAVQVAGVTEIYVQYYLVHNDKDGNDGAKSEVKLELDGDVTIDIAEYTVHNEKGVTSFVYTVDANDGLNLVDGKYTGSVNVKFINTNAFKALVDNVFISTDQHLLPPSDVDGDGTPDDSDAFVDNSAANTDVDGDGLADFFIDVVCKEGGVAEGADLAECNGLTLDTDDDNDGDSDEEEIAAGTDPLNVDSTLADMDADGWINTDNGDITANDNFPTLAYAHQAALTNAAIDYAVDAETATIVDIDTSSAQTEWELYTNSTDASLDYDIVDTTGHDGQATKAFKLAVTAANTAAKKTVQLISPLMTAVNQNVSIIRLAGWIKVTGPEVNDVTNIVQVRAKFNHDETGKAAVNKGKSWTFTADSENRALYNRVDNNGWSYFEVNHDLEANASDAKLHLVLKTDLADVEVLFDNLELNFINSGDFDEDGIIDAIDNDDDNDGIKDGLDASPLGDDAADSDGDGILDGYDDDFDGDGIADAFDDSLPEITIEPLSAVGDTVAQTITVSASATTNVDDPLIYSWTVNDQAVGGDSATLVLSELDYTPGSELLIEVTIGAGTISKSELLITLTNHAPTVSIVVENIDGGILYTATKEDLEGDDLNIVWYVDDLMVGEGSDSYFLNYDYFTDGVLANVNVYAMVTDVNRPTHTGTSDIDSAFIPLKAPLDHQPNGGSTQLGMLAMLLLGLTRRFAARTKLKQK